MKYCDGILWLNEKHIEGLDHKNLREITTKYNLNHRKHRYELAAIFMTISSQ